MLLEVKEEWWAHLDLAGQENRAVNTLLPPRSRPTWLWTAWAPGHRNKAASGASQCKVWQGPLTADPSSMQVFGLGNKTYEHFNAMGKYVDKRLEQLGAQRIFDLGLGDDDGK